MNWLYVHLGLQGTGAWYSWWSGPGSDLTEFAILGGLISIYRRHACHVRRCWRFGRHEAGDYVVCRRHHPTLADAAPTAAEVATSHFAAQEHP